MQITKRKFLPIAPDIVTVVAQVAAKRFHATPRSTSSMTRFWRPWPRTSRLFRWTRRCRADLAWRGGHGSG